MEVTETNVNCDDFFLVDALDTISVVSNHGPSGAQN